MTKWPAFGTVDGVEVVTIPRSVYEGLLQGAIKTFPLDAQGRRSKSRLVQDREVALFVEACIERRLIYRDIVAACRERFGAARTPSPSALSRHFQNLLR